MGSNQRISSSNFFFRSVLLFNVKNRQILQLVLHFNSQHELKNNEHFHQQGSNKSFQIKNVSHNSKNHHRSQNSNKRLWKFSHKKKLFIQLLRLN